MSNSNNNKVSCPSCGHEFSIEHVLTSKIQAEYEAKLAQEKRAMQEESHKQLAATLSQEKQKIEAAANKAASETASKAVEDKLKFFEEENQKKNKELKELKHKEIEFLKKEQALNEKTEAAKIKMEKEMLEQRQNIEEQATLKAQEKFMMEKKELEKKIEDSKKLAEEMQRKAGQGSMQLQGEVQELALEKLLSHAYPFDTIAEVPKGITGADCIQTVRDQYAHECGTIIYESKRTKNFSNGWIDKLKTDMIQSKGDIAVLVTEAMPQGSAGFHEEQGVWLCQFNEVKALSMILREMLIKVQAVKNSQENKGDKMDLLYKYLSSSEFVLKVRMVLETYQKLKDGLDKERKAMTKIWAEREKQIWTSQESVIGIFGSINGISNNLGENDDLLSLEE